MFDKAFMDSGNREWETRKAELLIDNPNLTETQLAEEESDFWVQFYDEASDEDDGIDAAEFDE
jgi:hypothetical protein